MRAGCSLARSYTPTLRPHDLGYIIVGDALEEQVPEVQRNPQVLPAGHAEYEVANMCPASCTRRMADEDLHVVSTTFHMVRAVDSAPCGAC
jgi:hypothetical protein